MTNDQSVSDIDAARQQYFTRSPDRPSGRVRTRSRQSPEFKKAKSRLRTAAWRDSLDKRGRPETDQVAVQFMVSLVEVARDSGHAVEDLPETKAAFAKMFDAMAERGFQRTEIESVIKRLTRRAR